MLKYKINRETEVFYYWKKPDNEAVFKTVVWTKSGFLSAVVGLLPSRPNQAYGYAKSSHVSGQCNSKFLWFLKFVSKFQQRFWRLSNVS